MFFFFKKVVCELIILLLKISKMQYLKNSYTFATQTKALWQRI